MLKKLSLAGAVLAMGATALIPATADAQRYGGHYGQRDAYPQAYNDGYNRDGYRDYDRGYRNYDRGYRDYDRGYQRGDYRHNYRRCSNGDGGTIIGAIAGGLLGNSIAGRGDRALGTVLGAGGGALAGRAIDRSGNRGYCRR